VTGYGREGLIDGVDLYGDVGVATARSFVDCNEFSEAFGRQKV
jgi:hypothetical protein